MAALGCLLPRVLQADAPPLVPDGWVAEPAVVQPLLQHPVSFAWAPDGALWIAEADPERRAARILRATDADADGTYETAAVFLEGLPWISSVESWREGVLALAAPDLIWATAARPGERADIARRLLIGFDAGDLRHRAGPPRAALDGTLQLANGRGAGLIQRFEPIDRPAPSPLPSPVDFTGVDLSFDPSAGTLTPAAGFSEGARVPDEFDHWYGWQPDAPLVLFPLAASYAQRNPAASLPDPAVILVGHASAASPLPLPGTLELGTGRGEAALETKRAWFSDPAGRRVLSARLRPSDLWYRPRCEVDPQAFAESAAPAFCPAQVRVAPDGSVWLADAQLAPDGASGPSGMIWRIRPAKQPPRPLAKLSGLSGAALAQQVSGGNRTLHDLIRQVWVGAPDPLAREALAALAQSPDAPAAGRVRALHLLAAAGELPEPLLFAAWRDPHPAVRLHGLRLAAAWIRRAPRLPAELEALLQDGDGEVRFQLALTLGEASAPVAPDWLARLVTTAGADPWLRAAVLTSAGREPLALLRALFAHPLPADPGYLDLLRQIVDTALVQAPDRTASRLASLLGEQAAGTPPLLAYTVSERLLQGLTARPSDRPAPPEPVLVPLRNWFARARADLDSELAPRELRVAAALLCGWEPDGVASDIDRLTRIAARAADLALRDAAWRAVLRIRDARVARSLVSSWTRLRPSQRARALGIWMERPDWLPALLEALEKGVLSVTELTPANRERVLQACPEGILRDRLAARLRAAEGGSNPEKLAQFAGALSLRGEPEPGRTLFVERCVRCHRLQGVGEEVGPDLTAVGLRSSEELLRSLLEPNAAQEPRFVTWEVETTDGREFLGILREETGDSLRFVLGGGHAEAVRFDQLVSLRVSALSLMPEGLDQGLSEQAMADLLAYLRTSGVGR